jgi:hypothetical protein
MRITPLAKIIRVESPEVEGYRWLGNVYSPSGSLRVREGLTDAYYIVDEKNMILLRRIDGAA